MKYRSLGRIFGIFALMFMLFSVFRVPLGRVFAPVWITGTEFLLSFSDPPIREAMLHRGEGALVWVRCGDLLGPGGRADLFSIDGDIIFLNFAFALSLVAAAPYRPCRRWVVRGGVVLLVTFAVLAVYVAIIVHHGIQKGLLSPNEFYGERKVLLESYRFWTLIVRFWVPITIWAILSGKAIHRQIDGCEENSES